MPPGDRASVDAVQHHALQAHLPRHLRRMNLQRVVASSRNGIRSTARRRDAAHQSRRRGGAFEIGQRIAATAVRIGHAVIVIQCEGRARRGIHEQRQIVRRRPGKVLHRRPHRHNGAGAHEERQSVERRLDGDPTRTVIDLVSPEILPATLGQVDGPMGCTLARDGRHERSSPHRYSLRAPMRVDRPRGSAPAAA